jgi:2-oxoacid:acceptor oxidoreductase delta subunit (pyruvate/2-ketoisovalerate family)
MTTEHVREQLDDLKQAVGYKEITVVSIAGQGGALATEILSAAMAKEGKFSSVNMRTTGERRMSPVINCMKVAEQPMLPSSSNYDPTELLVMEGSLFGNQHEWIIQAIQSIRRGILMVASSQWPHEVGFPYEFEGTVATVDATAIAEEVLPMRPAPSGLTFLGLYVAATGAVKLEGVCAAIQERFPGRLGEMNAHGVRLAHERAKVQSGLSVQDGKAKLRMEHFDLENVSGKPKFQRPRLLGATEGNPFLAWRPRLPVTDEANCTCKFCVTPTFCPEAVIFWRNGHYVVDYEFCKGCGICAEVCVHQTIQMVDSKQVHP